WHLACQTYALNLIDSHSGQNRAPQLFLSPKSFRVAKSTPSSAIFSAKLSPISKRLYKPPLQSKLRLLFKPSLLSKSALFLAPLLLLSYTQDTEALTAYTSRAIEGSAPYLTFDRGRTKLTNTDSLLSIKLQDGTVYTRSTNPSTPTNPIRLLSSGGSLDSIDMIVPPSRSSITMSDLVNQEDWGDDDGDGPATASGSISVTFTDKNGTTVNRSDTLDICKAPYKVTLTSTGGTLSTQYGVPRSSSFSGATVDYYINPNSSQPVICSVRPNLYMGGTGVTVDGYDDAPIFAGPANIWSPTKGFLTVFTNPSSYDRNFPTTGADGLYFDLDIGGDGSQLSWTVNTGGSIRATVSRRWPRTGTFTTPDGRTYDADAWISDKSKYVTRVTLHGPKADSAQISSSNPGSLARPSLPQTFELVGRDSNGNEVRYGFVLKQWFVNRGNKTAEASTQTAWCNSLGYRMPRVRDLTNGVCYGRHSGNWCQGMLGARPSSSNNLYKRHIGAGFFTEWGNVNGYADTGFTRGGYLTSEGARGGVFTVSINGSTADLSVTAGSRYAVCTTP
ncbi:MULTISPECIES: hypothetical protein, partial [unclassified Gilliamella]|uniref:hypothetical protein n=1 Tax=unclassified Gilliamella TaxID=2685620 RepID=UPI00132BC970